MKRSKQKPAPPGMRWVTCHAVKHWISKQLIVRKDGQPFRFLVRG